MKTQRLSSTASAALHALARLLSLAELGDTVYAYDFHADGQVLQRRSEQAGDVDVAFTGQVAQAARGVDHFFGAEM